MMFNKVLIGGAIIAFIALIGFVSMLTINNQSLSKENASLKEKLANLNTLIDIQNKQIMQDKLDIEAYQNNKDEIKERVIIRYVNLNTNDIKSCQDELKIIQDALKAYYER